MKTPTLNNFRFQKRSHFRVSHGESNISREMILEPSYCVISRATGENDFLSNFHAKDIPCTHTKRNKVQDISRDVKVMDKNRL